MATSAIVSSSTARCGTAPLADYGGGSSSSTVAHPIVLVCSCRGLSPLLSTARISSSNHSFHLLPLCLQRALERPIRDALRLQKFWQSNFRV